MEAKEVKETFFNGGRGRKGGLRRTFLKISLLSPPFLPRPPFLTFLPNLLVLFYLVSVVSFTSLAPGEFGHATQRPAHVDPGLKKLLR
jgi:hypothetical protein